MGNWRKVNLVGTLSAEDAKKVYEYLELDFRHKDWNCLHNGGICGLPNWGKTKFDCIGNLGERDYEIEDIHQELKNISKFAPSLTILVHCGGDYEDTACVKTIMFSEGKGSIVEPLIDDIGSIPKGQQLENLMKQLNMTPYSTNEDSEEIP